MKVMGVRKGKMISNLNMRSFKKPKRKEGKFTKVMRSIFIARRTTRTYVLNPG